MVIEFKDLVPAIAVLIVGIISGAITLWLGYRQSEPRLRPRPRLKTDLEILQMIDHKYAPYEYSVVKAEVHEMIKEIYERPTRKEVGKKSTRNWPTFAISCIIFVGFVLGSWYLVRDGFTWWVIGTGYGALLGIAWMTLSLRVLEPRYKVEPEPMERRKATSQQLHQIIREKFPKGDIHLSDPWSEAHYSLCDIEDIEAFLDIDETNHYQYVRHKFDCDNFARLLWGQFGIPEWAHFAIGLFWSDKHAMVVCIDANEDLWLIEPQNDEKRSDLLNWQGTEMRFTII